MSPPRTPKCGTFPLSPISLQPLCTQYHFTSRGNQYSELYNYGRVMYSFDLTSFNQQNISKIHSCYFISNFFFLLSY